MATYSGIYNKSAKQIDENNVQIRIHFNRTLTFFRIILFVLLLFWCIGFSLKSIFPQSTEVIIFSPVLKKIYSSVCFQDELKTFTFSGEKLFVCIRCTGIYSGALIFSFVSIFLKQIRISKKLFLAGLSAVIADVALYSSGIFGYSKYFAFVTGFFFGSVAFLYILIILETEFFNEKH
ncbi:MAG: DUF2085 domain-containing protein [Ignavibacteriaceae bacterium]